MEPTGARRCCKNQETQSPVHEEGIVHTVPFQEPTSVARDVVFPVRTSDHGGFQTFHLGLGILLCLDAASTFHIEVEVKLSRPRCLFAELHFGNMASFPIKL